MAHHLIMMIMNANTTHHKILPKTYTPLSLSLFCLNCRSISANWDCIHELMCNLSSRGFLFDIIGLTEVFKIPDCMSFNITGYHLLINLRSPRDCPSSGWVARSSFAPVRVR